MLWKSEDNANPGVPGPDQNGYTGIYTQHLSSDGRTLLGQPTKIFAPSEPWEGTIVESPDMVEAWGTYWLFYSGNWYFSPEYGIGVAACQSPFGPCTDVSTKPFIGSNHQGLGPGEESVFQDAGGGLPALQPVPGQRPGAGDPASGGDGEDRLHAGRTVSGRILSETFFLSALAASEPGAHLAATR